MVDFGTGDRAISGSWDATLKLWDLATGNCLATLSEHSEAVYGVAFHRGVLASRSGNGGHDDELKFWDLSNDGCRCLQTLADPGGSGCLALLPGPDGRIVTGRDAPNVDDGAIFKIWGDEQWVAEQRMATSVGRQRACFDVAKEIAKFI